MALRNRLTIGLVALAGLAFAAWRYGLAQNAMNVAAPQQQAATGDAKPGGQGQSGGRKGAGPIAVKLAAAAKADFPVIERSYGMLASPQVVNINSRIASQVVKVSVQEGQFVKKGDVLVELDDRPLQATLQKDLATLARDQAVLANNELIVTRTKTLAARNAGTLQDADNAVAAYKAQQQTVDADEAIVAADKVQLEFATIRAPFDGKLGAISAAPGALTAANSPTATPLMTLTQFQPLKVTFRLPEQTLQNLQTAMTKGEAIVRIYASGSSNLLDQGKLNFIDSSVDVTTGTAGFGAIVANDKLNLWPGERVGVEVEYSKIKGALTVPGVAVQQGQIGSYVWLVDDQNKVKATAVKVERFENSLASISDGLKEGDQVVVEGMAKLNNGSEVRTGKPGDQGQNQTSDNKKPDAAAQPGATEDGQKKHRKKDQAAAEGQQ